MYDINFYHSIQCYERSMSPALSKYRRNERMGMPLDSHAEKTYCYFLSAKLPASLLGFYIPPTSDIPYVYITRVPRVDFFSYDLCWREEGR